MNILHSPSPPPFLGKTKANIMPSDHHLRLLWPIRAFIVLVSPHSPILSILLCLPPSQNFLGLWRHFGTKILTFDGVKTVLGMEVKVWSKIRKN